jgi:hypothetical protein
MVEGTKSGELIEVYKLDGKNIYKSISSGKKLSISLPKSEIYLIKTNRQTIKILF